VGGGGVMKRRKGRVGGGGGGGAASAVLLGPCPCRSGNRVFIGLTGVSSVGGFKSRMDSCEFDDLFILALQRLQTDCGRGAELGSHCFSAAWGQVRSFRHLYELHDTGPRRLRKRSGAGC